MQFLKFSFFLFCLYFTIWIPFFTFASESQGLAWLWITLTPSYPPAKARAGNSSGSDLEKCEVNLNTCILFLGTKVPKHLCLYKAEQLCTDALPYIFPVSL